MNRTSVVTTGTASDYGTAVFAAIAAFLGNASQGLGVAVGFGLVTVLAIFTVTRVLND